MPRHKDDMHKRLAVELHAIASGEYVAHSDYDSQITAMAQELADHFELGYEDGYEDAREDQVA